MGEKNDPTIANANHYHLQFEVYTMYLSKAKREKIARLINSIECTYIRDNDNLLTSAEFNKQLGELTLMLVAEGIPMLCANDYLEGDE